MKMNEIKIKSLNEMRYYIALGDKYFRGKYIHYLRRVDSDLWTQRELAKEFGLSQQGIFGILRKWS